MIILIALTLLITLLSREEVLIPFHLQCVRMSSHLIFLNFNMHAMCSIIEEVNT